jgi:hypothetical protein
VEDTRNVVDAARAAGVPKFVHVGTEAVLVKVGFSGFYSLRRPIALLDNSETLTDVRFLPQASAVLRPRRYFALLPPPLFFQGMGVSMHMEAGFV